MTRTELLKKAKPIIFDTESVRAIHDGRKTATRQVIKPQPEFAQSYEYGGKVLYEGENRTWCYKGNVSPNSWNEINWILQFAKYQVGDILYVKETWGNYSNDYPESNAVYDMYRADYSNDAKGYWYEPEHINWCGFPRWRSPSTMPKEAARIFLQVTGATIERLQDITPADCHKEGVMNDICSECLQIADCRPQSDVDVFCGGFEIITEMFADLWDSTVNKADLDKYGWDANPYVWVYEFERVEVEE